MPLHICLHESSEETFLMLMQLGIDMCILRCIIKYHRRWWHSVTARSAISTC